MFHLKFIFSLIFISLFSLVNAQDYSLEQIFPAPTNGSIDKVTMDPSGKGYALGGCGTLYRTENFGENWREDDINVDRLWEFLIAPNTNGNTALMVGNYDLLLTDDGGDTWKDLKATTPEPITGLIRDGVLLDAQTIIAVTSTGFVWRTNDAGGNWTNTLDSIGNGWLFMDFVDKDHGWVMKRNGTILKTVNGGMNWTSVFDDADFMTNLKFIDANTGYKTNNDGTLSRTDDGGSTWTELVTSSNVIGDMFVRGADEFWFVYGLFLNKTRDAGATFENSRFDTKGEDPRYFTGFVLPDGRTWVGGQSKSILFSVNGVDNWNHQLSNYPFNLKSFGSYPNQELMFSHGTNSDILMSSDKGDTWSPMTPDSMGTIVDLYSPSNGHILFATELGVFEYDESTYDLILDVDNYINLVFSNKSGNHYFAYESRTRQMHYSLDVGATWQKGTQMDFKVTGVDVVDDNVFFAYGPEGSLAKSENGGIDWVTLPNNLNTNFLSADFVNQDFGVLIAFDSITITKDGGNTFDQFPRVDFGQEHVIMQDEMKGWMLTGNTSGANLYATDNGGEKWIRKESICQPIEGMYWYEPGKEIWLYGPGGGILVYRDDVTGISDQYQISNLNILPNPSTGLVKLILPDENNASGQMKIFDTLGKVVYNRDWSSSSSQTFDLNHLQNGCYYVNVLINNVVYQEKLVISN